MPQGHDYFFRKRCIRQGVAEWEWSGQVKSEERPRARTQTNAAARVLPHQGPPEWTPTVWKHTEPQEEPNIYLLKVTLQLGSLAKSNPLFCLLSKGT